MSDDSNEGLERGLVVTIMPNGLSDYSDPDRITVSGVTVSGPGIRDVFVKALKAGIDAAFKKQGAHAFTSRFTTREIEIAYANTALEKQLRTMLNKLDELATLQTKLLPMLGQIKHRKTSIKPMKGPPKWALRKRPKKR